MVMAAPKPLRAVLKAGQLDRAVTMVDEWRTAETAIAAARAALVHDLRGRGASWDSVGWLLGTTGSAARQRFGSSR